MNWTPRPKLLLTAFALETLSITWFLKIPGWAPFLSILYFISGVTIALLLLAFPAPKLPKVSLRTLTEPVTHYRLVAIALTGLALYTWCVFWFEEMPIDIYNADMLPIIKIMCERFIAGEHSHIYDTIPSIWHGVQPIYLPTMWQPYVPAIAMGIDMRWVIALALLFAFGTFIALYRPQTHRYLSFLTAALAFLLFWWVVADNTAGIVSVAEEGTVIAYYVLLVLALVSGRPWLAGIAASLCLLSRYAFIGWIPAYILYLILEKKGKSLLWFAFTGALCFVLFFLIPVGWSTFLRLASLPGDYVAFAGRVWKDSPDVFKTAPGFAWFFGPKKISLLHRILIILSFTLPTSFVLLARRRFNSPNLPIAALKLALVVFYCFIDVPYLYLFYTSSFVSLIIITLLLRERA
ncbi:MAG: hypothetical protein JST68_30070 [Bacteroidetes bacterium]|nr:hypothetical protein [Bacteroidota bacterium]